MRSFGRGLAMALLVSAHGPVLAQPTPNPIREQARLLFQAGQQSYAQGRYEEALKAFAQAYEVSRNPALLYNMGACEEQLGRPQGAATLFRRYLDQKPDAEDRTQVEARILGLERRAREVAGAHATPDLAPGPAALGAPRVVTAPPPRAPRRLSSGAWVGVSLGVLAAVGLAVGLGVGLSSSTAQLPTKTFPPVDFREP